MTYSGVPLDVSDWIDITEWRLGPEENRGLREKRWVVSPDGAAWLRKRPRPGRRYEPAIEWFALWLARNVGLNAPQAVLCRWDDEGQPVRGICIRSFVEAQTELWSGAEVLKRADRNYDASRKFLHSPWRVREALAILEIQQQAGLILPLVDVLLFDAWVGNADRHPGNWSILRRRGKSPILAPLYDPAGSLGAELHDTDKLLRPMKAEPTKGQRRERDTWLRAYIENCPSGFGDEVKQIGMVAAIEAMKAWPEWAPRSRLLLPSFKNALDGQVPTLLRSIDETWLPRPRKQFAEAMLRLRLAWLEEHG